MTRKVKAISLLSLITLVSFIGMANQAQGAVKTFKDYIGHSFSEDGWSIVYDVVGNELVEDFNPGPYADDVTAGLTDNNTAMDMNFYCAYTNYHGVQTMYMALDEFVWDVEQDDIYGCSPYQYLVQHFKPIGTSNLHVINVNKFLGLLAYRDNPANINGIPDDNDNLYLGWSFRSEWHKAVWNWLLANNSIEGEKYYFDKSEKTTATPIALTQEGNTYKYGMKYENIFILWQTADIEGLDDTVTQANIVKYCTAVGILSELTFTYVISYEELEDDKLAVTTSVEYDIGQFEKAYITDDTQAIADTYGGERLNLANIGRYVTFYDQSHLPARLEGDASTPGLSLSVINTANAFVVNTSKAAAEIKKQAYEDPEGSELGDVTKNITAADYSIGDDPTYKIDFAAKPTYVWNGSETLDSPTRVLKNGLIKEDFSFYDGFASTILGLSVADATSRPLLWLNSDVRKELVDVDFFYLTCFPKWSGETIEQDPTFTAYVVSDLSSSAGRRIPGFDLLIIGLIGIASMAIGIILIKKKRSI